MSLLIKSYDQESIFQPANLLREARRQKQIKNCTIPKICVLDPDGDILSHLIESRAAKLNKCWACYHTKMHEFNIGELSVGIIGNAVGASFAVLLAEQMFVSGCELLISITSSGIIQLPETKPEYLLITKALRDEGTSNHYIPPSEFSELPQQINSYIGEILNNDLLKIEEGISWTTDAPYRETNTAIQYAEAKGVHVVEMEAAALYAFAEHKKKAVLCYAHPTNSMAQNEGDFEKGEKNGSIRSLELIKHTIQILNSKSI